MKRKLLTILSAMSLALCVFTCVLWVRCDGSNSDEIGLNSSTTLYGLFSTDGRVYAGAYWDAADPWKVSPGFHCGSDHGWSFGFYCMVMSREHGHEWGGFGVTVADLPPDRMAPNIRQVTAPHWFLALAFAALPVWWGFRRTKALRLARRSSRGLCPSCGYDLRASAERCPECGVVTTAKM